MTKSHVMAEQELTGNPEWCRPLQGTPLVAFTPKMVRLIRALRSIFLEGKFGNTFEPWLFPRIMPQDTLARMGWLLYHREEAMFVSRKREISYRKDELKDEPLMYSSEKFPAQHADYVLDAVQCASLYHLNFGQTLDLDTKGIATRAVEFEGGWTFRNETNPTPLLRGLEFLRLEFVWIGSPEGVSELRKDLIAEVRAMLSDDLGLQAEMFPGEACFETPVPASYEEGKQLGSVNDIARFPSVDIVVRDPAVGLEPEGDKYLEIVSCGQHTDLPDRFKIRTRAGGNASMRAASACLGIGMTRLVTAFVARHGLDPVGWPGGVKRRFDTK